MADIGGLDGLMAKLGCDQKQGIAANTVDLRLEKYGRNELDDVRLPTYLELCWEALQDPIMLMLLASAFVQFVLACIPPTRDPCHADAIAWQEPFVILCSVAIVVNVAAATDYSKGKALREMKEERKKMNKMNVYRGGELVALEVSDIVVGDLCDLTVGDIIPADGHFVQGNDMEVDESPLTGEPVPIKKSSEHDEDGKNPWLIKGTKVVKGNCTFVAMAVGQHTTVGKINMQVLGLKIEGDDEEERFRGEEFRGEENSEDEAEDDDDDTGKSPLERKLEKMAFDITKLGFAAAAFGAVIAAIIWLILKFGNGQVMTIIEEAKAGHGHRAPRHLQLRLQRRHTAACDSEKTVIKPIASFWAKKECVDITMIDKVVKFKNQCRYSEYKEGKVNATTAAYPFKVTQADTNKLGDDTFFCMAFDGSVDPSKIVQLFVTAVTILVVAIPEGLPLAVTLALAVAQQKMSKLNNMVKYLAACETMGSATTICSDKTGTLTKNRMTVTNCFFGNSDIAKGYYSRDGLTSAGDAIKKDDACNNDFKVRVRNAIAINTSNTSLLVPKRNKDGSIDDRQAPEQVGNKTECGFLGLCVDLCDEGVTYETIRTDPAFASDVADVGRNKKTCKFPFSSERKRMSWIVPKKEGGFRMHCKGASEVVLARCTKILLSDTNEVVEMSPEYRQKVLDHIKMFANEANRTLVMAFRDFEDGYDDWERVHGDVQPDASTIDYEAEHELTFLGLVGIEDPLRDDVPDSITKCATAGVDVRMVTGDNIRTAIAIASNCGILREEHFMHLPELRKLGEKFAPYAKRLDEKFEPTLKLHREMRKKGFTEKRSKILRRTQKRHVGVNCRMAQRRPIQ